MTKGLLVLAALLAASVLTSVATSHRVVRAGSSNPQRVDFSIGIDTDGDGTDDCNTNSAVTTCSLALVEPFVLNVHINRLPSGVSSYNAFDTRIGYIGVEPTGNYQVAPPPACQGLIEALWVSSFVIGCFPGPKPPRVSYVAVVATADFGCFASGRITLDAAGSGVDVDPGGPTTRTYLGEGRYVLNISCGSPPSPVPPDLLGDANCDSRVDSLDASVILQFGGGLVDALPCPRNADVFPAFAPALAPDLAASAAQYVLEFSAGLIAEVPGDRW